MSIRALAAAGTIVVAFAAPAAAGSPSPNASCVGILVSFEAQLAPGFVGDELKAEAPQSRGAIGAEVREFAHGHAGSLEACISAG
jgi:hypothetical protein